LLPYCCQQLPGIIKKANKSIYLSGGNTMQKKALVIIDIQNDITKNYKDVIGNINQAVDWAVNNNIHVIYIRHENLSAGTRTFKTNTYGSELVSDLKIVSENVFTKYKGNALSSEEFTDFINQNEICEFYIAGADAVACVKSTCYNLNKANYGVIVLSDCIISYDKRKIDEMLRYYESVGSKNISLNDLVSNHIFETQ
jgi:nicotinamidase-related amidase